MLRPDYPIRTERLLLRPFTPDDVDDVHAYQSREDEWSTELDFAVLAREWTG